VSEPADLDALGDLCTPWCVHVAATLEIADHIAAGAATSDELAAAAGCDADALDGVLRHLVGKGVFVTDGPGRFALNDAAEGLRDPGRRIVLDLNGIGGRLAGAWGTLPSYVRTGQPAYHEAFGLPFWDDLAANPEIGASFDALMGAVGHGEPDPEIPLVDGWGSVRTVVDVGGGTGMLLAAILRARPGLRGTLVDLPGTVARSHEIFEAAGVADRVTTVAQSFFDPLPGGADLYLLMKVVNDWPDREVSTILRRCAGAAGAGGRVVVCGGVSTDDETHGLTAETVLLGGKARSISEFRALAGFAGLDVVSAERSPRGYLVECRPLL
jgi:2,7-dihydroxy-5-methyl-1-naphthoate 7-O-methyltransferase